MCYVRLPIWYLLIGVSHGKQEVRGVRGVMAAGFEAFVFSLLIPSAGCEGDGLI